MVRNDCFSPDCAGITQRYTPSFTSTNQNNTILDSYGSDTPSSWIGNVYIDNFSFANTPTLRPHFAAIWAASGNTSSAVAFFKPDECYAEKTNVYLNQGIMGMGGSALDNHNATDSWPEIINKKNTAFGSFSVLLCDQNGLFWPQGADANFLPVLLFIHL